MKVIINESQLKQIQLLESFGRQMLLEATDIYELIAALIRKGVPRDDVYNTIMNAPGIKEEDRSILVKYLDDVVAGKNPSKPVQQKPQPERQRTEPTLTTRMRDGHLEVVPVNKPSRNNNNDGNGGRLSGTYIDSGDGSMTEKAYKVWQLFKDVHVPAHHCARGVYNMAKLLMTGSITVSGNAALGGHGHAWSSDYVTNIKNLGYSVVHVGKYEPKNPKSTGAEDIMEIVDQFRTKKATKCTIMPGDVIIYYNINKPGRGAGHTQFCVGGTNGAPNFYSYQDEYGFVYGSPRRGSWAFYVLRPNKNAADTFKLVQAGKK